MSRKTDKRARTDAHHAKRCARWDAALERLDWIQIPLCGDGFDGDGQDRQPDLLGPSIAAALSRICAELQPAPEGTP